MVHGTKHIFMNLFFCSFFKQMCIFLALFFYLSICLSTFVPQIGKKLKTKYINYEFENCSIGETSARHSQCG